MWLRGRIGKRSTRQPKRAASSTRRRGFLARLEELENRHLLATFAGAGANLLLDNFADNATINVAKTAASTIQITLTGDTWSGTNNTPAGVSGNGTATLTINTATFTNQIRFQNSNGSDLDLDFSGGATSFANAFVVNFTSGDTDIDFITTASTFINGSGLQLTATGAGSTITDSTGSVVVSGGVADLDVGNDNDITLDNSDNNFGTVRITANNATLVDDTAIVLDNLTVDSNFNLTAGGNITDTANAILEPGGSAVFDAAGTITLANNATDVLDVGGNASFHGTTVTVGAGGNATFGTVTFNSNGAVSITEDNDMALAGNNTASNLTLTSSASITDLPSTDVSVTDDATLTAGTGITLTNSVTESFTVENDAIFSGSSISIVAIGTANFDRVNFNSTGVVNIIEDSAMVVFGANTANTLTLVSDGTITDAAGSSITTTSDADFFAATSITLDAATLALGGNAAFDGTGIAIDAGATANFGSLTFNSTGGVNISEDSATELAGSSTANSLSLTSNGAMTDSGSVSVTNTATLAAGAANDITLDSTANDFDTVVITSGNNVTLADANGIDLGASTVSGDLSVTASGLISDSGTLSVVGTATFAAGALNNITLNTAANNFNIVSITNGNVVTLVDTNAIDLGAILTTGPLTVTAGGDITDSGNVTVGSNANFNAGSNDVTLGDTTTANFGNLAATGAVVDINEASNTDLNLITASTSLSLVSAGFIVDNNGASNNIASPSVALTAANGIGSTDALETTVTSLAAANTFDGNIQLINSGALTIGTVLGVSGISNTGISGDINLTLLAGSVQSSDATTDLAGDVVSVVAPAGFGSTSATPGNAIQTSVNTLNVNTAAGSQFILESDGLTLFSLIAGGAGNDINVTSTTGDITVATVAAADDVNLTASAGNIFDDGNNPAGTEPDATSSPISVIVGDLLRLRALRSIGGPGGIADIDTRVGSVDIATTGAGPFAGAPVPGIFLSDDDDLVVTSALTGDGGIQIDATSLDAQSVIANGLSRNVQLRALGGDLHVGSITAVGDIVRLFTTSIITDGDAGNDITALSVALGASGGVGGGAADPLETTVSNVGWGSGSGSIDLINTGALTITAVTAFGFTLTGGQGNGHATVSATSPLTVAANIVVTGNITLTATDSSASGDDLTVQSGVTVQSTAGNVVLQAGDDLDLQAGSTVQAAGTITGTSDFGDADAGVGTSVNVLGALGATSASFAGGNDSDTFGVTPSSATTINIDGNNPIPPANPGDSLNVATSGATSPTLASTSTASGFQGSITFGNRLPVNFQEIETLPGSDLSVTITDNPDPVAAGSNLTYTITLANNGFSDGQDVALIMDVPANTTFASATQTSGPAFTLALAPAPGGTGTIQLNADPAPGTFAAGATATFEIVVNVNANLAQSSTITSTVFVNNSAPEFDTANNSATETTGLPPSVFVSNATIAEGGDAVFTLTLTNPSAQTVTVRVNTTSGTATGDVDYNQINTFNDIVFAPGETTQTIGIPTFEDTIDEPDEAFNLNILSATNAAVVDALGIGTITDNDAAPAIGITDATVTEGNAGGQVVVLTVALSNPSGQTVTVEFTTLDDTATTADDDYETTSGTLTFAPGDTVKTIEVTVNGDTKFEVDERLLVNLSNPNNATIADGQGEIAITNDDAVPAISINDVTLAEGNGPGTTAFVFTVTLSNASGQAISANYVTNDGTATVADGDYIDNDGTVAFPPGETTAAITVLVNGDLKFEPDETFAVDLIGPGVGSGSVVAGDINGEGAIINDEPEISIAANDGSAAEHVSPAAANPGQFTVTRTGNTSSGLTVFYTVAGTAANGADYTTLSGSVVIGAGQSSAVIDVNVINDAVTELPESVVVTLAADPSYAVVNPTSAFVVIAENEPEVSITANDASASEHAAPAAANPGQFTVTRTGDTTSALTVNYTVGGTAANGGDYATLSGSVVIDAGQSAATIDVSVINDELTEADETVILTLAAGTYTIADPTSATVTIADNDPEPIIAVGTDAGGPARVRVFDAAGTTQKFEILAYAAPFAGGVRVALGDITGDGRDDIITAIASQGGPHVRVFDGTTGQPLPGFFNDFLAYNGGFNGGVFVSSGDVTDDDVVVAVVGRGRGGAPEVRVFSGEDFSQLRAFNAYAAAFASGVFVGAGDINGDGKEDIITGAGKFGGPQVRVFSGEDNTRLASFFAYSNQFTGGVRVSASDVNGDGFDDIVTGAGPGGGPQVRIFSGQDLTRLESYFAFENTFRGGVFVAGGPHGGNPLHLASNTPAATSPVEPLTAAQLDTIRAAAFEQLAAVGVSDEGLDRLAELHVGVADLANDLLGLARGNSILIDRDAAGRGWFVDPTPTTGDDLARDRADLLTALLHELGHVLGLEHDDAGLMLDELQLGVRLLPTADFMDAVFSKA